MELEELVERWLAEHIAHADPRRDVVREELLALCRRWRVEPRAEARIDRVVRASVHAAQRSLTERNADTPLHHKHGGKGRVNPQPA